MLSSLTTVVIFVVMMVLFTRRWRGSNETTINASKDGVSKESPESSTISSSPLSALDEIKKIKRVELRGGPRDGSMVSYNKGFYVWLSENDVGCLYRRRDGYYSFERYLTDNEVQLVYKSRTEEITDG